MMMLIYGNVSNTWYSSDHPNANKTFGAHIPIPWVMSRPTIHEPFESVEPLIFWFNDV